ncbi:MAG: ABC transporter ATP-binding protein, partial [Pseudomonadota bacterium]
TCIRFDHVTKCFQQRKAAPLLACGDLCFEVRKGEVIAIVGETGCGKSTCVNLMLGLIRPDRGEVRVLGHDPFERSSALDGAVAIVFQNDRLLPWRTAVDKIAFGLEVLHVAPAARRKTAARWLDRVGLNGFETAYPHELSGGMRQRVAIARAFAIEPRLLYADEAFTALDELTATRVRRDLLELVRETGITTLFITHSIPEAVEVAQRILVFGRPAHVICEIDRARALAEGKSLKNIEELVREGLTAARADAERDAVGEEYANLRFVDAPSRSNKSVRMG